MTPTTITSHTKIQVGLAVALVTAAGGLFFQIYSVGQSLRHELADLGDKVETRYISKELFSAEMAAMRRESDLNVRTLADKLTELRSEVSAIKSSR
jgi:hypothetical protein